MPHFQIEYSANLEEVIDMGALCEAIRAEAALIEAFPMAGIRVRATPARHYAIADGNPAHGFIDGDYQADLTAPPNQATRGGWSGKETSRSACFTLVRS